MKERIRTVMDYAQMTQQDFAARLGISPASLSSIFTGRTNPSQKQVMAIHHAFPEINISWLMFGEGEMIVSSSTPSPHEASSKKDAAPVSEMSAAPKMPRSLFDQDPMTSSPVVADHPHFPQPAQRENANTYRQNLASLQITKNIDKPSRKIKEIRVFFDDGTYESFVPSNK